jgi:hypothetical protein
MKKRGADANLPVGKMRAIYPIRGKTGIGRNWAKWKAKRAATILP